MGEGQPRRAARLQPRPRLRPGGRLGPVGRRRAPRLRLVLRRRRRHQLAGDGVDRAVGGRRAEGLRFLAKYQRADGKITHEISQAAGVAALVRASSRTPTTTPTPRRSGSSPSGSTGGPAATRRCSRELWPATRKAWAWCLPHDTDGDGIIENTTGGLGRDRGGRDRRGHPPGRLPRRGVDARRRARWREMAAARGEAALAAEARGARGEGPPLDRVPLLDRGAGHHAFGILRSGRTNDTLTVWPATAAAFGLFEPAHAATDARRALGRTRSPPTGARGCSRPTSPLYDPTHYNMGAVWPFVTGFVALGHYRYERPWAGYPLVDALSRMAFDWARGRHPELLSGRLLPAARHRGAAPVLRHLDAREPGRLRPPRAASPTRPRGRARLAPAAAAAVGERAGERAAGGRRAPRRWRSSRSPGRLSLRLEPSGRPARARRAAEPPPGARGLTAPSTACTVPAGPRAASRSRSTVRPRASRSAGRAGSTSSRRRGPRAGAGRPRREGPGLRGDARRLAARARGALRRRRATVRLHGERPASAEGATLRIAGPVTEATVAFPASDRPFARADCRLDPPRPHASLRRNERPSKDLKARTSTR